MPAKRIKVIAVIQILLLFSLLGRLVQVQLISTESFTKHHINLIESSVKQRSQVLTIDDGRGKFYDRNGESLGHEEIPTLILFPFLKKMNWPSKQVAAIIGVSEEEILSSITKAKKPFAYGEKNPIHLTEDQMVQINALKIPGVFAVKQNYVRDLPAEQLIGTLTKSDALKRERYPHQKLSNDTKIGNSGLQSTFDEFLLSEGESKLVYHVDGTGGPLFGIDVKYLEPANPLYPVKVITTIDKNMQEAAEKLTDQYKIEHGGLLVLDIDSSEIRALVSRPKADKHNPNSVGSTNLMFTQNKIGSVFKTVIAAAAIDHQLVSSNPTFNCNLTINGTIDQKRKLGTLNFEDSFAQSCNRAFGELAQQLSDIDPDIIENYSKKLNLIGQSGWKGQVYHSEISQLYHEEKGRIWDANTDKKDKNLVAHTGIGQQDVQVTPLAVANMMATIARGGESKMVKAVSKVEFKNGATVVDFSDKTLNSQALSPYTTMKLQFLLRGVVTRENGTGRWFQGLPYDVAGKSGTAQTGKKIGERELYNKWFAGYFPYKNPKYVLVAVNLDVPEDSGGINPLFADMVKEIYKLDNSSSVALSHFR